MNEAFRELKEDIAKERLKAFWHDYGRWLALAGVVFLLVSAGKAGLEWRQEQEYLVQAERFAEAEALRQAGDVDGAIAAFTVIGQTGAGGYAQLALLHAAQIQAEAGWPKEAQKTLQSLLGMPEAEPFLRQLAALREAELALQADPSYTVQPESDSPLSASLLELKAATALRTGDTVAARTHYETLAATGPSGMRARAQEILQALGPAPNAEKNEEAISPKAPSLAPDAEE